MRRHLHFVALPGVLLTLLAFARLGTAHAYVPRLSFEDAAKRSSLILTGRVIDVRSYMAPFHDAGEVMFTDVTVRIETVLKGTPATDEVTIQVLGGRIGTAFQRCLESATYEKGERVLVFLREYNGKLWNTGWLQGKYTIAADGATVKGNVQFPIERDVSIETVRSWLQAIRPSLAPAERAPGGASPRVETPVPPSGQGGVK